MQNSVLQRNRDVPLRDLENRADWIRLETIRLVEIAKSGHYSSVFSCAEMFAALYYRTLRLNPTDPLWADRDRFLLGKGHAAIGQYPILADLGYFPADWLDTYTRLGSALGDHPDMNKVPGCDFSSGSIGHNLSVGVGIALAAKMRGRDYLTWVMLGDGELNEGQVWEAAQSAAHYGLANLIGIVDANGMGLDGDVGDVMNIEPIADKFAAFGWSTQEIDGHDMAAVVAAFDSAQDQVRAEGRPHMIVARTKKGKGVGFMETTPYWHLGFLGPADKAVAVGEIEERMAR
ncbi:transketolase [Sphingomonas immobilis]|uniref:Transketolase n=1 Tax=Sphingomonas immobilis TaxID=3063997 RepID=A0ABT8ZXA7_9SPHN|nr:transketolase [Sphingomonas sp. CA1-15]MDO7842169.1 transketolase [Sphingomonas sp. CA1-15]